MGAIIAKEMINIPHLSPPKGSEEVRKNQWKRSVGGVLVAQEVSFDVLVALHIAKGKEEENVGYLGRFALNDLGYDSAPDSPFKQMMRAIKAEDLKAEALEIEGPEASQKINALIIAGTVSSYLFPQRLDLVPGDIPLDEDTYRPEDDPTDDAFKQLIDFGASIDNGEWPDPNYKVQLATFEVDSGYFNYRLDNIAASAQSPETN